MYFSIAQIHANPYIIFFVAFINHILLMVQPGSKTFIFEIKFVLKHYILYKKSIPLQGSSPF